MQAILDICAYSGWLSASLSIISLMQMACQGRWSYDSDLLTMPHIETDHLNRFYSNRINCLPRLIEHVEKNNYQNCLELLVGDLFDRNQLKDIYQTLSLLPQIEIDLNLTGSLPNKAKSISLDILNETIEYEVFEDEDYAITLNMSRVNRLKRRDQKAYAPKYPKPKDENWVVILGVNSTLGQLSELVGLKRVTSLKQKQLVSVSFKTPKLSELGSSEFQMSVYFMSDVYIGLDQQFEFKFKLAKKN